MVEPSNNNWHAIGWGKALAWVGVARDVGVTGNLPPAQVDGFEAGPDHLGGLGAGEGAECGNVLLCLEQMPQAFGPHFGQGVLDFDATAELDYVFGGVVPLDAGPSRVDVPTMF